MFNASLALRPGSHKAAHIAASSVMLRIIRNWRYAGQAVLSTAGWTLFMFLLSQVIRRPAGASRSGWELLKRFRFRYLLVLSIRDQGLGIPALQTLVNGLEIFSDVIIACNGAAIFRPRQSFIG